MNVFTVDVEEWFHVCGLETALPPERWHYLARACGPHDHAGARSAGPRRRQSDIFRGGLGCRALSGADRADRRGGPRGRVSQSDASSRLRAHSRSIRRRPVGVNREHRRHRCPSSDGVPRAGMVDQRSRDLGARRTGVVRGSQWMPAWRLSRSLAASTIAAIRTHAPRQPVRSSSCRRSSPIASVR